jgi:hypothetical protein
MPDLTTFLNQIVLVVLGFGLKISCLLGRYSTILATLSALDSFFWTTVYYFQHIFYYILDELDGWNKDPIIILSLWNVMCILNQITVDLKTLI